MITVPLAQAQTVATGENFGIVDRGSTSFETTGPNSAITSGFGSIQPNSGNTAPAGVAIYGFRQNGVLVTEAGVPAVIPSRTGRTYAELGGAVNTGIAVVNPNVFATTITFYFTDANGTDFGQSSFTLGPNQQMAKFINQAPFTASASFAGTFTFSSSLPVGVTAIRGFTNERGEFLITTQTVTPLPMFGSGVLFFPHFADGGGWTTQVILVNPTDTAMSGNVLFFGEGTAAVAATPVTLNVNGQVNSNFNYSIPPRSSIQLRTSNTTGSVIRVGSVQVSPASGGQDPIGLTIFSYVNGGVTVSQSAVPPEPVGTNFRVYAETAGVAGQVNAIQTGVAITNTATSNAVVNFELTASNGLATGSTVSVIVPASGHISKFISELFPTVTGTFRGVLRISSSSAITVAGLRTRYNERGDFLTTTTQPSNETNAASVENFVFPQLADSGGYTTEFILFSGSAAQTTMGRLQFYDQSGAALALTFK